MKISKWSVNVPNAKNCEDAYLSIIAHDKNGAWFIYKKGDPTGQSKHIRLFFTHKELEQLIHLAHKKVEAPKRRATKRKAVKR